jgi:4-alpha-glucanotransferase
MKSKAQGADEWGILEGYEGWHHRWHPIGEPTRLALRKAMKTGAAEPGVCTEKEVMVVRQGEIRPLPKPSELTLEDGSVARVERELPPDLPIGYHSLRTPEGGEATQLIVAPGRCHLPENPQEWGWALQLYALRSENSWGMGDFADLRRFARWSGLAASADFILLNPLGAPLPILSQEASPYFAGSRLFLNPLYLRVEEAPGAEAAGRVVENLAAAGRALNAQRLINRDAVFCLKMEALEKIFAGFRGHENFNRYCAEQGETLRLFAVFCALAEHHKTGWSKWPAEFRHPKALGVGGFAERHEQRVRFHQWLQWLLDEQLARAAHELPLMLDVPIGMNPDGFDAWLWQDLLALGASVGAPPDEFNAQGQNWALPPFIPARLRAAGYEPLRRTLRMMLRHARGLRFDHVMGLFRLYWIPEGAAAVDGGYVRYPAEELLAVVAIESQRAKAMVVGEDLGTVEPGVRARLRESGILSYRLLWFEHGPPEHYPREALAAITTHDLPTVAGLWSGKDFQEQERLGLHPNAAGTAATRKLLRERAGLGETASTRDAVRAAHRLLARTPCRLRTATLEDALAVEERPNMPGTTAQWPNWRIALPKTLEEIERDPLVGEVARIMDAPHARPTDQ